MLERPRIINVERKPSKCPVCGERVVDIIYGTGDMDEAEFMMEYRRDAIMGGDNIPRRPPIWACACGCKRFRKVNPDGTDAKVKVKMLKDIRPKPLTLINFSSSNVFSRDTGALRIIPNKNATAAMTTPINTLSIF